ncbi:MAG: choice-of-anchor H family protein [Pseudomonadales bacterium]
MRQATGGCNQLAFSFISAYIQQRLAVITLSNDEVRRMDIFRKKTAWLPLAAALMMSFATGSYGATEGLNADSSEQAKQITRSTAANMQNKEHEARKTRPRSQTAVLNTGFWVYSAVTALQFDDDADGHYTRLIVDFDVDSSYLVADVFARLYLSRNGGVWTEYAVTENFSVLESDASDNYVVETDLLEGYPSDYYDALIEVYDAFDGDLVAEFGPADSVDMIELPLEDELNDRAFVQIAVSTGSGGGGSIGMQLLFGLIGLLMLQVWYHKFSHCKEHTDERPGTKNTFR